MVLLLSLPLSMLPTYREMRESESFILNMFQRLKSVPISPFIFFYLVCHYRSSDCTSVSLLLPV